MRFSLYQRTGSGVDFISMTDLKDVCTNDRWEQGSFDPVGPPRGIPNTSLTESLTCSDAPHLLMGRGCSATGTAADSGN